MALNSDRLMPLLTSSYCGIWRYFSNSAAQAISESGGMAPVTGFHSVMERPDPVSRVAPPTATMATTSAARRKSQACTSFNASGRVAGSRVSEASAARVMEKPELSGGVQRRTAWAYFVPSHMTQTGGRQCRLVTHPRARALLESE